MSSYKNVDLLGLLPPEEKRATFPPEKAFEKAVVEILEEIVRVENGTSLHVIRPIHFPNGICPLRSLLSRFRRSAEASTYKVILTIAEQDFGIRFREYVEHKLGSIIEGYNSK